MTSDEVAAHELGGSGNGTAALTIGETRLPTTLRQAVKTELGVAFHSPV